ncbi:hypothetical protein EDP1_3653 [Pseudomonas putida S610]|nr:hypothetical protein EDP1_3653 [Pseudomonas putida S610]
MLACRFAAGGGRLGRSMCRQMSSRQALPWLGATPVLACYTSHAVMQAKKNPAEAGLFMKLQTNYLAWAST